MAVITLTSDWGTSDYYLAAVKGKIIRLMPEARIVDISHHIPPFDVAGAAFAIKNSFDHFPEGSIHICGVSSEESAQHPHCVVKYKAHYFIAADNGFFSLMFGSDAVEAIELEIPQDTDFFTFSTRDRFVKAALHLMEGKSMNELGSIRKKLTEKLLFKPVVQPDVIRGIITHVDNYENLITNIDYDLFRNVGKNRTFSINLRGVSINKLHHSYTDVGVGDVVALFASNGWLEIAINHGNAASLLGIKRNDSVNIEFI